MADKLQREREELMNNLKQRLEMEANELISLREAQLKRSQHQLRLNKPAGFYPKLTQS